MRSSLWFAVGLLIAATNNAVADPPSTSNVRPAVQASDRVPVLPLAGPPDSTAAGGDDIEHATFIPSLPYTDVGTTCRMTDNYKASCAYIHDIWDLDVVYSFTPPESMCVDIMVCSAFPDYYQPVVYVCANAYPNVIGCTYDSFPFPEQCTVYRPSASMYKLQLLAHNTYYIIIDSWSRACLNYSLTVREAQCACATECPPGARVEGEATCQDNYQDVFDGGCNSTPHAFRDIQCSDDSIVICGTYGTYRVGANFQARDTDWYQLTLDHASPVRACVSGESKLGTQVFLLDGNAGCPPMTLATAIGDECHAACVEAPLQAGTYWVWVGAADYANVPCDSHYHLTISGYGCRIAVQGAQWSKVKSLYR